MMLYAWQEYSVTCLPTCATELCQSFSIFKKRTSEISPEYNAKSFNNCFVLKVFFNKEQKPDDNLV